MNRRFSIAALFAVVATALVLTACGGSGGNSTSTPASPTSNDPPTIATDKAGVRTVNVTSDPSSATLDINGVALVSAGSVDAPVSNYTAVTPGTASMKLSVSSEAASTIGSTISSSQSMSLSTAAGDRVTVLAMGDSASAEAISFKHSKETIAADKTGLRVLHAARRVGDVDIYLSGPTDALPAAPTIPALAFRKFAPPVAEPSLKVAAGDARVRVTLAGAKDVVFDSGKITLPGGKDVLVAAITNFDGVAPIALLLLSEDSKPVIVREPRAGARAIHLSPDTPTVDVLVNDKVTFANAMYRDATRYKFFAPGKANVKVNLAGTSTTAITADLDLMDKTFYSIFAVDKTAKVAPLVIADDGAKPDMGKAKVRVLHGSPDVPAVDVYVDLFTWKKADAPMPPASGASMPAPGASAPMVGASAPGRGDDQDEHNPWRGLATFLMQPLPATPAIAGLKFKDVVPKSGDAALQLDAGIARIRITLTGAKDVVFDSGAVPLRPRDNVIFAAIQPKAGAPAQKSPVDLLAIGSMGERCGWSGTVLIRDRSMMETMGSAEVRAGHFSPDAHNVDVLVDGEKVLSDVAFSNISDYLKVPTGKRDIKVNLTGTATTALNASPIVMKDMAYSVFAINFAKTIKPLLTSDQRRPMDGDLPNVGFVRVIHASPDAGKVDVLAGGKLAVPNVPYETVSAYLPVPSGKIKLAIAAAGSSVAIKEIEVDVASGTSYTVAAIGTAAVSNTAVPTAQALRLVSVRDSRE